MDINLTDIFLLFLRSGLSECFFFLGIESVADDHVNHSISLP
jgi:hypothetical protein